MTMTRAERAHDALVEAIAEHRRALADVAEGDVRDVVTGWLFDCSLCDLSMTFHDTDRNGGPHPGFDPHAIADVFARQRALDHYLARHPRG